MRLNWIKINETQWKCFPQKNDVKVNQKENPIKKIKFDIDKTNQYFYQRRKRLRLRILPSSAIRSIINRRKKLFKYNYYDGLLNKKIIHLNFTPSQFFIHMESQFKPSMNWKNHGDVWHVDHKIPASWFKINRINDLEYQKCWALINLQPLFIKENLEKGNRWGELPSGRLTTIRSSIRIK